MEVPPRVGCIDTRHLRRLLTFAQVSRPFLFMTSPQLDALTPNHVRRLYRQKLDGGLAPRTVNYIHVTLHKALKDAVSDALIPRNAASVRDPRPEKPEIHPLSPDQARKLIATARETEDR